MGDPQNAALVLFLSGPRPPKISIFRKVESNLSFGCFTAQPDLGLSWAHHYKAFYLSSQLLKLKLKIHTGFGKWTGVKGGVVKVGLKEHCP